MTSFATVACGEPLGCAPFSLQPEPRVVGAGRLQKQAHTIGCSTLHTSQENTPLSRLAPPQAPDPQKRPAHTGGSLSISPLLGAGLYAGGVQQLLGLLTGNAVGFQTMLQLEGNNSVFGGGIVGTNAALMAAGLGADVTICDISLPRLRQLNEFMPKNVKTLYSSTYNIEQELPTTDLVIGAVLIPGAKTPHLITKDMLKLMRKGSVLVDVAIDQGGCFETSHPTTHAEPIYEVDGIVHYCVANIPGAVPCTSTLALTNATLPYAIRLADMGWEKACEADPGLKKGLNIVNGKIVFPAVAEAFGWEM